MKSTKLGSNEYWLKNNNLPILFLFITEWNILQSVFLKRTAASSGVMISLQNSPILKFTFAKTPKPLRVIMTDILVSWVFHIFPLSVKVVCLH